MLMYSFRAFQKNFLTIHLENNINSYNNGYIQLSVEVSR